MSKRNRVHESVNPFHKWAQHENRPKGARRLACLTLACSSRRELIGAVVGSDSEDLNTMWHSLDAFMTARGMLSRWVHMQAYAAALLEDTIADVVHDNDILR
jgi:hypothetical protein